MDIREPKTRYECMLDIAGAMQPSSIIEIGVHNGVRAEQLVQTLKPGGTYQGYDAWDLITDHESVFNGKGPGNYAHVQRRLQRFGMQYNIELHHGFTELTLRKDPHPADFVFIDGDHRTEEIYKDFHAVAYSRLICFDDVVVDGPKGAGVDAEMIAKLYYNHGLEVDIIDFEIPFKPHGLCAIAFVYDKDDLEEMYPGLRERISSWQERVDKLKKR